MAEALDLTRTKSSLLQYENATLVTTHPHKKSKAPKEPVKHTSETKINDSKQETIHILNQILPPREWEENGKKWIQKVSSNPASRLDVISLQEKLNNNLTQRKARGTGICPVRRELYSQCFDEIIRQVTINCAERGILLTRVKDEIMMTMIAYRTLLESSIAFGIRKSLAAEKGSEDFVSKVEELEKQKRDLEAQLNAMKIEHERFKLVSAEAKEVMVKKNQELCENLKQINQQLKTQFEGLIPPRK